MCMWTATHRRHFIEILYVLFCCRYFFPPPCEYFSFTFEITLLKMFQMPRYQIWVLIQGFVFEDLGSLEEFSQVFLDRGIFIYANICYICHKELAHRIMAARKSQDLQSASWRPRRAQGVIPIQKPASSRPRKSQCFSWSSKLGGKKSMSQLKDRQLGRNFLLLSPLFLFRTPTV